MQRTILCYGDSNTWGYIPSDSETNAGIQRYSRSQRWTGLLQNLLGEKYYVVEEGLNGRTTNLNYHVPPDRNGKTYLPPCLYTHAPIDLVVLALGGNDFKAYFNRTAEEICHGLAELISVIQNSTYGHNIQRAPEILILLPPKILPIAEKFQDENGIFVFEGAIGKSELLINLCAELARKQNCRYLNIAQTITASPIDGLHLDANGHQKLSHLIYSEINRIYEPSSH